MTKIFHTSFHAVGIRSTLITWIYTQKFFAHIMTLFSCFTFWSIFPRQRGIPAAFNYPYSDTNTYGSTNNSASRPAHCKANPTTNSNCILPPGIDPVDRIIRDNNPVEQVPAKCTTLVSSRCYQVFYLTAKGLCIGPLSRNRMRRERS